MGQTDMDREHTSVSISQMRTGRVRGPCPAQEALELVNDGAGSSPLSSSGSGAQMLPHCPAGAQEQQIQECSNDTDDNGDDNN